MRRSVPMGVLARFGLTAYALIYLMIGVLTFVVAFTDRQPETDQRGAMQAIAVQTGGAVLILVIALGLSAYSLWRFAEAIVGAAREAGKTGPRLQSLFSAVTYALFASTAFVVFGGRHQSQADQSRSLSAKLMTHIAGRLLIAAVGTVVLVVGVVLIVQGAQRRFEKYLRANKMSATTRRIVVPLGVVGSIARGALFTLVGALIIEAAVRFKPDDASGIDAAIGTLADQPYGRALLAVTALGLVAFGIYGLVEARWRAT
jgi:hypothetical protein